jgi:hypothetical protein
MGDLICICFVVACSLVLHLLNIFVLSLENELNSAFSNERSLKNVMYMFSKEYLHSENFAVIFVVLFANTFFSLF